MKHNGLMSKLRKGEKMTVKEFLIYNYENPGVYLAFEKYTFEAINTGRKYFSARAVWERMRWESMLNDTDEDFKLSDHPIPFYARLFEKRNPQYRGFFRKKRCEADAL